MNKKNLVLGGILVVLVALAYFYQGPLKEWRSNLGKPDNFLAVVGVEQINKIEIIKNGETTVLEKTGERWKISGTKNFYVKEDLANSLTNGLEEMIGAEVELASTNKDKKSDFQADQESGTSVKLSQGDEIIVDFVVGKRGVDFTSTYISKPESNETYIIDVNISSLFNRTDWYDRTIFSLDKSKISKIRFQYPNREFIIAESAEDSEAAEEGAETAEIAKKWEGVLPYKFSVDEERIDKILDIMSNLIAVEIPEQIFEGTGLEKNLIIVQATGEGIDNTLMIGDANEEELYYTKRGDSDNVYLITKEQRDELDKQIRDLR